MLKLYSIRDSKTEAFNAPFKALTHPEAIRMFQQIMENPETLIAKFPADYALFYVGTFDEQSGRLMSVEQALHLVSALELKQAQ